MDRRVPFNSVGAGMLLVVRAVLVVLMLLNLLVIAARSALRFAPERVNADFLIFLGWVAAPYLLLIWIAPRFESVEALRTRFRVVALLITVPVIIFDLAALAPVNSFGGIWILFQPFGQYLFIAILGYLSRQHLTSTQKQIG